MIRHLHKGLRYCSSKPPSCWDCRSKDVSKFFCASCNIIQPAVGSESAFEVFSLPPTLEISERLLERQYKTLQMQLHPDKFTQKSDMEFNYSQERSSEVNQAYAILSDPLERAKHLLKVRGAEIAEGENISSSESLMVIFELREEIDEACGDLAKTQALKLRIHAMEQDTYKLAAEAFEQKDISRAKEYVIELIYLKNLSLKVASNMPVS